MKNYPPVFRPVYLFITLIFLSTVSLAQQNSGEKISSEKNISVQNPSLVLYPNPASNSINIKIPDTWRGRDVTLEMYDVSGHIMMIKVFTNTADILTTPLDIPGGLYLVKLKQKGKKMLTENLLVEY